MARTLAAFSGACNDVLDTVSFPTLERGRAVAVGAAMLVPPTFAGGGLGLLVDQMAGPIAGGVVAGVTFVAVVVVEAAVVRTFGGRRGFVMAVARIAVAATIGLVASQGPLVLLFEDRVNEQLAAEHRVDSAKIIDQLDEQEAAARTTLSEDIAAAQEVYDAVVAALEPADVADPASSTALNQLREDRACLVQLLSAEQSGVAQTLPCGTSSGLPECLSRCQNLVDRLQVVDGEIRTIQETQQATAVAAAVAAGVGTARSDAAAHLAEQTDAAERRFQDTRNSIAQQRADATASQPANDVLSRIEGVHEAAMDSTTGQVVLAVATLFFFLLDTIGMLAKTGMPAGEHGLILRSAQDQAQARADARTAAVDSTVIAKLARQDFYVSAEKQRMDAALDRVTNWMSGCVNISLEHQRIARTGRETAKQDELDLEQYDADVLALRPDVVQLMPDPPNWDL